MYKLRIFQKNFRYVLKKGFKIQNNKTKMKERMKR